MTWTSYQEEEQPSWCTGVWQPLPDGYNPVLPLMDLTAPTLRVPAGDRLLMPLDGKLPPFMDPTVGVFIRDQGLIPDMLAGNTRYQNPYHGVLSHGFAIGRDRIGDPDAIPGGPRIPHLHPELPTNTISAVASQDGLRIIEVTTA